MFFSGASPVKQWYSEIKDYVFEQHQSKGGKLKYKAGGGRLDDYKRIAILSIMVMMVIIIIIIIIVIIIDMIIIITIIIIIIIVIFIIIIIIVLLLLLLLLMMMMMTMIMLMVTARSKQTNVHTEWLQNIVFRSAKCEDLWCA